MRRRLLLRVGIREAAALAAPQPREARRAWRPRSSTATWWRRRSAAIDDPAAVPRSVCAMGHKWMWNADAGRAAARGVPRPASIRCWREFARSWRGRYETSDKIAGRLGAGVGREARTAARAFRFRWARSTRTGTRSARASGEGDVVNVVGTSTCIMAISEKPELIPGVCGVVQGSVHPRLYGHRSRAVGHRRHLRGDRPARGRDGGGSVERARPLSRRGDRAAAVDVGQRRPDGAGESGAWRRDARMAAHAHGAGRTVRRDRGHGLPYARHPGADGGAWNAGAPDHQRRRHSAEATPC